MALIIQFNLLGDSGYPCLPWLLTPLLRPHVQSEENYNKAHKKTRQIIERAFGLMKMRFRCMDKTGGALQYSPKKVIDIVTASVVVHNFAIRHNVGRYVARHIPPVDDQESSDAPIGELSQQGSLVRENLITQHFL